MLPLVVVASPPVDKGAQEPAQPPLQRRTSGRTARINYAEDQASHAKMSGPDDSETKAYKGDHMGPCSP